ncbi:hypothetical protein HBB16_12455 [Pseudonocardia sp. MCCB 268]|nr:hypothetical protein [Pseudonocardia cytotoxica]
MVRQPPHRHPVDADMLRRGTRITCSTCKVTRTTRLAEDEAVGVLQTQLRLAVDPPAQGSCSSWHRVTWPGCRPRSRCKGRRQGPWRHPQHQLRPEGLLRIRSTECYRRDGEQRQPRWRMTALPLFAGTERGRPPSRVRRHPTRARRLIP